MAGSLVRVRAAQIARVVMLLLGLACWQPKAQARPATKAVGLALPAGSKVDASGRYRSALGFKKTVVYFERYLRSRKQNYQELPSLEVRGVLLRRFLSQDAKSEWLAVHVYQLSGVTWIYVVPRASAPEPSEKPTTP